MREISTSDVVNGKTDGFESLPLRSEAGPVTPEKQPETSPAPHRTVPAELVQFAKSLPTAAGDRSVFGPGTPDKMPTASAGGTPGLLPALWMSGGQLIDPRSGQPYPSPLSDPLPAERLPPRGDNPYAKLLGPGDRVAFPLADEVLLGSGSGYAATGTEPPAEHPAVDFGNGVLRDRPGPQLCSESWTDGDGRPVLCNAVLGPVSLSCSVCAGRRCYWHCRGVEHLEGAEPYCGPITCGDGGRFVVRVVRLSDRFYGHLARPTGDNPRVLAVWDSTDSERVLADAFMFADALGSADFGPALGLQGYGGVLIDVTAPPAPAADPDPCSEADHLSPYTGADPYRMAVSMAADQTGDPDRIARRRRVATQLQAQILNAEAAWERFLAAPDEQGEPAEYAKALRDAELADLIATLESLL